MSGIVKIRYKIREVFCESRTIMKDRKWPGTSKTGIRGNGLSF